ncbi:DUF262 domain-containing protein [Gordonia terrae]
MAPDNLQAHDGVDPEADEFIPPNSELETVGEETEADLADVDSIDFRDVVLAPSDWTVGTLLGELNTGSFELNPDFQRRNAWTDQRKSKFVESLILSLPIPQLVLAETDDDESGNGDDVRYIVIDGKQRLLALQGFFDPVDPLRLVGLSARKDLNGKTYQELKDDPATSRSIKRLISQTIRTVVIRKWPSSDFLHLVFHRINHQTLALSAQELRQALNPGPFTRFSDQRAGQSEQLHRVLGSAQIPDFRMRDVELLVRFLGYKNRIEEYRGNLKKFLDETCAIFNEQWPEIEDQVKAQADECEYAIDFVYSIFDNHSFSRYVNGRYENRFNRAIFDSMLYYFSDPVVRDRFQAHAASVKVEFERLSSEDRRFNDAVASTTKTVAATAYRLEAWGNTLGHIVDVELQIPRLDGSLITRS